MNKIAFFSTSSRPIKSLLELSKKFEIVLIVTKEDKVIGKNRTATPNEVKSFAIKNNIPFVELSKFNMEMREKVVQLISKLKPDVALSFDFGFIIPKDLLSLPKFGFINTHFSLLPKHRGASAVQFAILNDDSEFGITYHIVDATLDTGDIIYQSKYLLDENLKSDEAYSFLFEIASKELPDVLSKYLLGELIPLSQDHNLATYTYSKTNPKHTFIFKEDAILNPEKSEREIFREIKAFNPWPLLEANILDLLRLKQFSNYSVKKGKENNKIKILDANYANNQLIITEVTVVGGKRLKINEFLNGYFDK